MARWMRRHLRPRLEPPVVVGAGIVFRPISGTLVAVRRRENGWDRRIPLSNLRAPVVVNDADQFFGPKEWLAAPLDGTAIRTRQSHWKLSPPTVLLVPPIFFGPQTSLTPSSRQGRLAHYKLEPPAVVGGGIAFYGPRRRLARLPNPLRQLTITQRLAPPAVVRDTDRFFGPLVYLPTLNIRVRQLPHSKLEPPAVVRGVDQFFGPAVLLTRSKRPYFKRANLQPPTVLQAPVESYYGPATQFAQQSRGKAKSKLFAPAVVNAAEAFYGPDVHLTPSAVRPSNARLSPPAVVAAQAVYYGPQTHLTKVYRPSTLSLLRPPVIPPLAEPTRVALAYSRRGRPLSRLEPPVVVFLAVELSGPEVTLAPSSRLGRQQHARLEPPTVVFLAIEIYGPEITLTRIRPPRTIARLVQPIGEEVVYYGPQTTFAPSKRGRPTYRLEPPTVINTDRYFGPTVHLARNKPQPTLTKLGPLPPGADVTFTGPSVSLAYSRRGVPKSQLIPPTVVGEPELFTGPKTTLARIRPQPTTTALGVFPPQAVVYAPVAAHLTYSRRGAPHYFLRGLPIGADITFSGPVVELAPSFHGRPLSFLQPPAIGTEPVFLGPAINLTYSRRGKPTYRLEPPTVINTDRYFGPKVTLTRNKVQPTVADLAPPSVVQPQTVVFYGPQTTLAYSRRGEPFSVLRAPAVVGGGIAFRPVKVTLVTDRKRVALERVLQRAPMYFLRPPQVLFLREFDLSLRRIRKELAYSVRGRPIYELRKPVVVREAVEIYGPEITLAPSRFPRPESRLLPPAVVGQPPFRGILTSLAPSRFPTPKSHLEPPVEFLVFRPIHTTLATNKPQPTLARLAPPAVVRQPPFRGLLVSLAPSRFPTPKSHLRPPAVVRQPQAGTTAITFVRILPAPTIARLIPPAVVGQRPFRGLFVSLAPSSRGRPTYKLQPPAVVNPAEAFFGPAVTLVRITPPPTVALIKPPSVVITTTPGDVICEDDTPFETFCEDDAPGSTICSDVSGDGGTLVGGDSSTSGGSVSGGISSNGSVEGGDRRS